MTKAIVKGGYWDNEVGDNPTLDNTAPVLNQVKSIVNKQGTVVNREIIKKLAANAVGAGGNVTLTRARVKANNEETLGTIGGKVEIETVSLINRATTNDDRDAVIAVVNNKGITSFPTNKAEPVLGAKV